MHCLHFIDRNGDSEKPSGLPTATWGVSCQNTNATPPAGMEAKGPEHGRDVLPSVQFDHPHGWFSLNSEALESIQGSPSRGGKERDFEDVGP